MLWQQYKVKYQLSEQSKSVEYFRIVNDSVYLMQSIMYLMEENPYNKLLIEIKY